MPCDELTIHAPMTAMWATSNQSTRPVVSLSQNCILPCAGAAGHLVVTLVSLKCRLLDVKVESNGDVGLTA